MRRMPIVQVRPRVERWQRPRCRRSGAHAGERNSGTSEPAARIHATDADNGCDIPSFGRASFAIFLRGARHGFVRLSPCFCAQRSRCRPNDATKLNERSPCTTSRRWRMIVPVLHEYDLTTGDVEMALTATDLFNDATTREIGGVGPDQVNLIVSDLVGVQQMLSAASPQINNLTDLHTHVIINQLNEEIASIENANSPTGTLILGTNLGQFVGRAINDIHRDIIDIAQGDAGVQALFNPTPLPAVNTPPAPFHDDAAQTAFVTQWIQDSNHLGQMATTIENNGFTGDIAGLVQQIQTFNNNSNAFDQSQGGLFSARFWNEFRTDGTSGTAATALIEGLQTHNAGEVNAAVEQLATNSADVGTNNLMADGGTYADVVAAAQATAGTPNAAAPAAAAAGLTATDLFNDATTREIGGVGPA